MEGTDPPGQGGNVGPKETPTYTTPEEDRSSPKMSEPKDDDDSGWGASGSADNDGLRSPNDPNSEGDDPRLVTPR